MAKRVRYFRVSDRVSILPDGLHHLDNLVRRLVLCIALDRQRIHQYLDLHVRVFGQGSCQTPIGFD